MSQPNPLTDYSSDRVDSETFIGLSWDNTTPRLNAQWDINPCFAICESVVSQDDAELCADRLTVACANPCLTLYSNTEQVLHGLCPDGLPYYYTVDAGLFTATSQLLADREAFTYGFKLLNRHKICLSDFSASGYFGFTVNGQIKATGNFGPFKFTIISGSLPDGVMMSQTSDNTITISGTPTVVGNFVFTIEVRDSSHGYMDKTYSIFINGCLPVPFLPNTVNGNIDGSVADPYRAGFFSQKISFNGVVGNNLNIWMQSSAYPEYLYLVDPSNNILEQVGSGGAGYGIMLRFQLVSNGVHTIIASTLNMGQTGPFTLRTSSSAIAELAIPIVQNVKPVFAHTSKYIFLADAGNNHVSVVDPFSNTLVKTIILAAYSNITDIAYCHVNDTIYALCVPTVGPTLILEPISSAGVVLGTPIDTTISSTGAFGGMTYDSTNNRLAITGLVLTSPNFVLLNCATNAIFSPLTLGSPHYLVKPAYVSSVNKYYVSSFNLNGAMFKVDAASFAVTTSALQNSISFQGSVQYIPEIDIIVFRGITGFVAFAKPSTDTIVLVTALNSFISCCFDSCNNELRVVRSNSGLSCFDSSTLALKNMIEVNNNGSTQAPVFVDLIGRTFVMDGVSQKLYTVP